MIKNRDLEILFHAYSLDNHFSSTKISRLFKYYSENIAGEDAQADTQFFRQKLTKLIGVPSETAWINAKEEVQQALDIGIEVISFLDDDYPPQLLNIADPPLTLFVSGKSKLKDISRENLVLWSIVGARNASQYGNSVARHLATEMYKAQVTVVSGLAYGIDKSAHEGALIGSLNNKLVKIPTIAVLGSGLLEVYPRSHNNLAYEIIESGGLIISEYGLRTLPRTFYFPRRNRIISGLSKGVVVVEARKRSGSLITARIALEQGRELYCVPGPIDSGLSDGVNQMIKDGAGIINSITEFIEMIAPGKSSDDENNDLACIEVVELDKQEKTIVKKLQVNNLSFDDLLEFKEIEEIELRTLLLGLELKEIIVRKEGNYELNPLKSFQKR